MEQAQIETVGSVVVDNKFPKITLNKDGTPRKPWTAKNPRKKVARQTYNEIHVSLSDEVYAFIESYCGRKKVGHLVRKLLAEFMQAQKALTLPQTPPTKEERLDAVNKLLNMYILPGGLDDEENVSAS